MRNNYEHFIDEIKEDWMEIESDIKTPGWVIKAKGITKGSLEKYADFCELFEYRQETNLVSNSIHNAGVYASNLLVIMKKNVFTVEFLRKLLTRKQIEEMVLQEIRMMNGKLSPTQVLIYKECEVMRYKHTENGTKIELEIRYNSMKETIVSYDETGKKQGVNSISYDSKKCSVGE